METVIEGKKYTKHSTLSLNEASEMVNLDPRTLKPFVESGKIRTKWIGERRKIIYGSLMEWLYGDERAENLAKKVLSGGGVLHVD